MVTGNKPFSGMLYGTILNKLRFGGSPIEPEGGNECLSDDIWNFMLQCSARGPDSRPDIDTVIRTLKDGADSIEGRPPTGRMLIGPEPGASCGYWSLNEAELARLTGVESLRPQVRPQGTMHGTGNSGGKRFAKRIREKVKMMLVSSKT